jgi:hypothetical protein
MKRRDFVTLVGSAALVSVVFIPSARAVTVDNDLFVCTGELIKLSANDYSIKETWISDDDIQ